MLNPFTSFARTGLALAVVSLTSACVGVPSQPISSTAEPVASTVAPQSDQQELPPLPDFDIAGEVEPLAPAPEVNRGNALAFDQAVDALRGGRLDEAELLLRQITVDQPELAGPWVNLGQVYALSQRYEQARSAFAKAVEANPRSCAAHNQLGVLSRQFGDFRGAEEHYRACLAHVPSYKDAYLNLGILYELYLGKLPQALEAYRRYQHLAGEPDRRVQGWVVDLERRLGV